MDEAPKIVSDENWKEQAQREKEAVAEQAEQPPRQVEIPEEVKAACETIKEHCGACLIAMLIKSPEQYDQHDKYDGAMVIDGHYSLIHQIIPNLNEAAGQYVMNEAKVERRVKEALDARGISDDAGEAVAGKIGGDS